MFFKFHSIPLSRVGRSVPCLFYKGWSTKCLWVLKLQSHVAATIIQLPNWKCNAPLIVPQILQLFYFPDTRVSEYTKLNMKSLIELSQTKPHIHDHPWNNAASVANFHKIPCIKSCTHPFFVWMKVKCDPSFHQQSFFVYFYHKRFNIHRQSAGMLKICIP